MRWSLHNQVILPVAGLTICIVLGVTALNTYLAGARAKQQIESRLRNVVDTLATASFPLTDGVLAECVGFRVRSTLEILQYRYRGKRVYVASNLLVYYEEGLPRKFVVPDDFVVLDCDPHRRRVFKTWEESKVPDVVFEVTSRGTRSEDESFKPQINERIGVQEYFLYDPSSEYLQPALQGFRRQGREGLVAMVPDHNGSLTSETLCIVLRLDGEELAITDLQTGDVLTTEAEAERAAKEVERVAKEAERAAREAAERRIVELQAEVDRLRRRQED